MKFPKRVHVVEVNGVLTLIAKEGLQDGQEVAVYEKVRVGVAKVKTDGSVVIVDKKK